MPFVIDTGKSMPFNYIDITFSMDEIGQSDGIELPFKPVLKITAEQPKQFLQFKCKENIFKQELCERPMRKCLINRGHSVLN